MYAAPKYVDGRKYLTNSKVRHAVTDAGLAIMFDMQLLEDEFYRLAMMKKCVNININATDQTATPLLHTPPKVRCLHLDALECAYFCCNRS